jgi:GNAT superfamily N-acetyltransferase
MELGHIVANNLSAYRSLLLPQAARAIERGEALTAVGVAEGDLACGALAGFLEEDCFRIASLYMAPDYRRKGGGRLMLDALADILNGLPGAGAMRADYAATEPEHDTLEPFFERMGFSPTAGRGRDVYFFTLGQATASSLFAGDAPGSANILPFSKIPNFCLAKAALRAGELGVPMSGATLTGAGIDRDISVALMQDKDVIAFLAFDRSFGGRLTVGGAWTAVGAGLMAMPAMLRGAFRLAMGKFPPETEMAAQAVTDIAARMIHAIVPDARPVSRSYYRGPGAYRREP